MSKKDANPSASPSEKVIHVVFGPGGGRVPSPAPAIGALAGEAALQTASLELPLPTPISREPVGDLFSGIEVAKLLGLSAARLRSLDRAGIAPPSGRRRGHRAYTFSDLIALRAANCDMVQGFYYAPALESGDCVRYIEERAAA